MEKFTINKETTIPIYQQLYLYIKDAIERGDLHEGDILMSENEMIKEYNISRITIRRALSDLEHDGYVRKRRGAGTVVLHQKKEKELSTFKSFSGDAKVNGDKPGSIILKLIELKASVKVSSKLKIPYEAKVYYLKRLRLLNGRIIALHESYIRSDLGFKIGPNDFDVSTSLYEYLENHGIELGSADETLEAKMASTEIKKDLFLEENQAVVYKERVTYDKDNRPIEFSENTYIGDIYKYYVHIVNVR